MREEGWMIEAFWECAGNVSVEDIGALSPRSGFDFCDCQLPALDSSLENWTLVLPELPCAETGHFTGLPSVSGV